MWQHNISISYTGKNFKWHGTDTEEKYLKHKKLRKHNLYGPDDIDYVFNSHGYRCDEFTKIQGFKILSIGCSMTFGTGIKYNEIWPIVFSNKLNYNTTNWNLSRGGVSNSCITRMLYKMIPILQPDLVLIYFTHTYRREYVMNETEIFNFVNPEQKIMTKKKKQIFDNFLLLQNDFNDLNDFHKNFRFIELILKDIPFIWSVADEYVIKNCQVNMENFCGYRLERKDYARDLMHPGPISNSIFAAKMFDFYQKNIQYKLTSKETRISSPIIHEYGLANRYLKQIKRTGELKGVFKPIPDLTFITIHNYTEPSLFEQSLSYLGIRECCEVLQPMPGTKWRDTLKIEIILQYLNSNSCKTKLLMFCDARDVILRLGPEKIVEVFESYECDLLFMSTEFIGGYMCMPKIKEWADSIYPGRYINSGVYIGYPDFMLEVITEAAKYLVEDPLTYQMQKHLGWGINDTRLCDRLPDFPRGLCSDQEIFRYLHPKYYPRMKVDYTNRLAWRNDCSPGKILKS